MAPGPANGAEHHIQPPDAEIFYAGAINYDFVDAFVKQTVYGFFQRAGSVSVNEAVGAYGAVFVLPFNLNLKSVIGGNHNYFSSAGSVNPLDSGLLSSEAT